MGQQGHGFKNTFAAMGMSALLLGLSACAQESELTISEFTLTGDPWIPQVAGVSASNHDAGVTVSTEVLSTVTGSVVGWQEGWGAHEIEVSIDMTQDLGAYGSVSLLAETVGFPSSLAGGAYPMLTFLSDGTNEFLNLARSGVGGDCVQSGTYTCSGTTCALNPACTATWPSAYFDASHWVQHQMNLTFESFSSTNTFPSCDWAGGAAPPSTNSACAFNSTFFVGGKLRSGVSYTAKYILMLDSYTTNPNGSSAGVRVSVVKKTKTSDVPTGAIDVNVIMVGNNVSQASRNAQGKVNLDSLMASLQASYSQSTVKVKIGTIRSFEWLKGEPYANVSFGDLGKMVAAAGAILPAETSGKAINLFMVSTVSGSSSLLGISGGIGGPMVNGLPNSGVVVSTFNKLDKYNPHCSAAPCSDAQIEMDFADLEATIAHEMGHYMGLNHPGESTGTRHDVVQDTPICTATSGGQLSITSCRVTDTNVFAPTGLKCSQTCTPYSAASGVFCPAATECQFNHLMYWSSKYFTEGTGTGDGNMISTQSGKIINFHPLVQ